MLTRRLEHCPVCSSSSIAYDYSAPTTRAVDRRMWTVWRCNGCTHGFMNPQPSEEELAPYYNPKYEAYDPDHGALEDDSNAIERAKRQGSLRHIALPTGKRLLDVGCGGGYFLRLARALGAVVEGVEPSSHGAAQARSAGIEVFNGTLEQYLATSTGKRFDVVTANHVIEHVPNPVETLTSMKKILAPEGYIWIAVPNAGYPIAQKLRGHWHSTDLPYHLMQFSPRSITLAAEAAGLRVRSLKTESIPRIVAESLRLYLRHRWWIPRRLSEMLRIIDSSWAPAFADSIDRKRNGEAIITEFVAT